MSEPNAKSVLAMSLDAQFPDGVDREILGQVLGDWLTPDDAELLRRYARVKLDEIRQLGTILGDPEDAEELYHSLASYWLELRTEWTRYNQLMNYRLMKTGEADAVLVSRGTVVSSFQVRFETLLTPDDRSRLEAIASEPLEVGRPDLGQLNRALHRHIRASKVLEKAIAHNSDAASLTQEYKSVSRLDCDEIWPVLRLRVQEELSSHPPFTMDAMWDTGAQIAPEDVVATFDAFRDYISAAFASEVTATPTERVAAGQTAHVAFHAYFKAPETEGTFPTIEVWWEGGPERRELDVKVGEPA